MRYVIIRDDDTNGLTPVDCLERLYRPFLERGLPVNLATIPDVATDTHMPDGRLEGYLPNTSERQPNTVPMAENRELVNYLLGNPGYHIVQHGCHHRYMEFDHSERGQLGGLLERGTELLIEAGFSRPQTFVAPYDRMSRAGLQEVVRQFRVFSSGWYELRRLPCAWWPGYVLKRMCRAPHWQMRGTMLLAHPGCLLSYRRTYPTMLGGIVDYINTQRLTVLVTHWWEYFRDGRADEPFIEVLHETAAYLATHREVKVISFNQLAKGEVPLN